MPISGGVVLAAVVLSVVIWGGAKVGHGVKVAVVKTDHAIVHIFHPHKKAIKK